MENVWTDLLVACLLCIVSSVYWYIFKDSTCPRVIFICFPGVTFLIGKEYALWQESSEHLNDWRSVLISVCACLSYAGFIASSTTFISVLFTLMPFIACIASSTTSFPSFHPKKHMVSETCGNKSLPPSSGAPTFVWPWGSSLMMCGIPCLRAS